MRILLWKVYNGLIIIIIIYNNINNDNDSTDIEQYVCLSPFLEIPPLQLNISTSGYTEVGQSFNMTCSVRVVEGLVQQPNVAWMKMDDVSMGCLNELNITTITVIDRSVTNVTVILDPVLFEYRGVYICIAEYNISLTNDADSDSQEYELIVDCKYQLQVSSHFSFPEVFLCPYLSNHSNYFSPLLCIVLSNNNYFLFSHSPFIYC